MSGFGVLLQHMGACQLSYNVIRNVNKLADTHPEIDIIAYYETMHKNCLQPNFAIMQIAEAWGQHKPLIATSLSTAFKLISFPTVRKLFYVWDLEWLRGKNRQYEQFADVYTHPELELVARSEAHADAIENAFNRKVNNIVSDFDIPKLMRIFK